MDAILSAIETSALGQLMRDSVWLFPAAEILHFTGLSLLIGSLLVVDFRLLGGARHFPVSAVYRFLPLAVAGFSINLITGTLFFSSDPFRYYPNIAFRLKMLLIILAGLNALYFAWAAGRNTNQAGAQDVTPALRAVAALSLSCWVGVIVLGRFIPYVE